MSGFFRIDGPLMRGLSELTSLFLLNILTVVCSLPVVTAGAAITSMHYCIMKMVDGEDTHLASMFISQFKSNLKSMTLPGLVFFGFGVFLYFDYQVFLTSEESVKNVAIVLIYAALVIYLAIYVWFFPLAARFENSFGAKFKNAFLMAVGALPRTFAMIIIWAVILFVLTQSYSLLPLAVVFGLSFPAYLSSIFYYPVIKRQMKIASGEPVDEKREEVSD